MQVNMFNLRKQSSEIKMKQEQRMGDIRDIIQKILKKDPSLSKCIYKENEFIDYLPVPTTSITNLATNYIHMNFKECHDVYRWMLDIKFKGEDNVTAQFDELINIYKSSQYVKIISFSDNMRDDFNTNHFQILELHQKNKNLTIPELVKHMFKLNGQTIDPTFNKEKEQY